MAVTLEKIYYTAMRKYGMRLEGDGHLDTFVTWLHIVENGEIADFLKGGELVITTGIMRPTDEDLYDYARKLDEQKASGLIINIGPYITDVPREVIEYSREHLFPVFSLPWSVHLVEFNREFCNMVINSEQEDQNLCGAFRNAIFFPEDRDGYVPYLLKKHISLKTDYCMIKCLPDIKDHENDMDVTKFYYELRRYFERIVNRKHKPYVIFRSDIYITIVLSDTSRTEVENIIAECQDFHEWQGFKSGLYFAVSRYDLKIETLSESFEMLTYMCRLCRKKGESVWYYDELGEWTLIFSVDNIKNLKLYERSVLGQLEEYNEHSDLDYCALLDAYLSMDGNMQEVADAFHMHRNTVSYHLKKIEDMLHVDLYSTRTRTVLYLALRIREIMML